MEVSASQTLQETGNKEANNRFMSKNDFHFVYLQIVMWTGETSIHPNVDELFRALGWRTLAYQRLKSAAVMMYKSLNGRTPEYLSSKVCVSIHHNIISIKEY